MGKCVYRIYLDENPEDYETYSDYVSRSDELAKMGIYLKYFINSCVGHEYFVNASKYYARMKELRLSGVRVMPFIKENPKDAFMLLYDYNKQKKKKA